MASDLLFDLAADVADFPVPARNEPEKVASVLQDFYEFFSYFVERHNGSRLALVVQASNLARFPNALEALACAVEFQQDLAERRLKCNPVWRSTFVRVAVIDNITESENHGSTPLNDFATAKLLSFAEPGGISISYRALDRARDQLNRGECTSRESSPEKLWQNLDRLSGMLSKQKQKVVQISPTQLDEIRPFIALEDFQFGDVYIDYPFEDAKFRYEKESDRYYRRFYGGEEMRIPHDSCLLHDAISGGKPISRSEYFSD